MEFSWAAQEMAEAQIGDERNRANLIQICTQVVSKSQMARRKPDHANARGVHQPDRGLHVDERLFVFANEFLDFRWSAFIDAQLAVGIHPNRDLGVVQPVEYFINFHSSPADDGLMTDDGL